MSQPSPLAGIAARGGRVDVPPLLPEDTGDFTAAEARALAPRQPILTNVPDRALDNAPVSTQPPADQTAPDAVPTAPPTTTGPDVQTGTEMPVPPPTAAAGAGAGGILGEAQVVSSGKPDGAAVETTVDFVEATDLAPLLQREVNADQTRDRANNRGSAEQVARIAVAPDPQLLGVSPVSSIGAPVVDDKVLAGNGRAEGLIKGYTDNTPGMQRYRSSIEQQAAQMGRDISTMRQPVMIRRVQRYVSGDRRSFVRESNPKYAALQETTAEAALLDAEALGDLSRLEFNENGTLTSAAAQQVAIKLKEAQRGVNATTGGKPDVVEATRRVQLAALATLARQNNVDVSDLSAFLETDTGRRVLVEFTRAAPGLAALDVDLGLGDVLLPALTVFNQGAQAVQQRKFANINEWATNRNRELIRESLPVEAEALIEVMVAATRKPSILRGLFESYLEAATNEQQQRQLSLGSADIFGETRTDQAGRRILARVMADQLDAATANPQGGDGQASGEGITRPINPTANRLTTTPAPVSTAIGLEVLQEQANASETGTGSSSDLPQGAQGFKNLDTSGRTAGFLNTEILAEGAALIRRGVTDFTSWSRAMVQRFGAAIREFLAGIWQQITSPQTTAAQNVRLGMPQGTAPVTVGEGGFVGTGSPGAEGANLTEARFAPPNEADQVISSRRDVDVLAEAQAWLAGRSALDAVAALEAGTVALAGDAKQRAMGVLINRLSQTMMQGDEAQQTVTRTLLERMSRLWVAESNSADVARELRQRAVANNADLAPVSPILATLQILVDRGKKVLSTRFTGGEGALTRTIQAIGAAAGRAAGTSALNDKRLQQMLDALRKKIAPGMTWTEIFTDMPEAQKARQREIYRRLMLDERLAGLTLDERVALTNELDKAWQRERRTVFQRELQKAGVLGEKKASDRQKVVNGLPKLLRLMNLGVLSADTVREVIAAEYGLRSLSAADVKRLRDMGNAAYQLPEGSRRNRALKTMMQEMQALTGATWTELLSNYWTASVLSGLRTQFDTFLSVLNGLGANLMQAGTLLARGQGRSAVEAHAQWWRYLASGALESMQILAKGDTTYLKQFGDAMQEALKGERTSPIPAGEMLWRNGNVWQKYFMAPVMIFTGRLMAAADHLNNTATTGGALAVARALNPELYAGRAGFTAAERAAARTQAILEVTGGTPPATMEERAQVSIRTRELLSATVEAQDVQAASEIGDMAAFQNDPTGVFGSIYSAVKQGLGSAQRKLGAVAEDEAVNRHTRALSLVLASTLHGITGTRFMRFGFNFGADITRYIPGTYLLGKAGFYGRNVSRMQQDLLLGKNLVGLMLGSTLAAMFLSKDDEEDGWHIEGDWSTLTPQEQKQRMSAGLERMTMWKRENGQVSRVSYKQWPTMGLFAMVGRMLDEKRHKPDIWAQRGTAGHLGAAALTGMFQIQNVSAMQNLAQLFGQPTFAADPAAEWGERITKMFVNYPGGLVPTLVKDADIWADPRSYKPEGMMELMARNIPIARRFVNDGRPQLNQLGEEVKLQRAPWSRAYTTVESGDAHRVLGGLLARGLNLPAASDKAMITKDGVRMPIEALGGEAVWRYEKAVGEGYRAWLASPDGQALLTMPVQQAERVINYRAESIKRQAKAKVTRY